MPKSIHRPEYDVLRRMLRQARLDAGLTQAALSSALGRSQSYISDIERGVRRLDVLELRDLLAEVGQDIADFVTRFEARNRRRVRESV